VNGFRIEEMKPMAQLTVRNLGSDLVRQLKIRAAQHNRSAEAEHRAILETALRPGPSDFWRLAAELREETRGRAATDSTALIREDRDRDHRDKRG
jgi:plasmid stability protein